MTGINRRGILAAGATLASGTFGRNSRAAPLSDAPASLAAAPGDALPEFRWTLADGTVRTMADYAGQGVVLNLWATWCVPCVAEMPALDGLAGMVKGSGVVVLPLASDRGGAAVVEKFYREHGLRNLPVLLDPSGAATRAFAVRGIPTTLLIDKAGRERGRIEGGADWSAPVAVRMVRSLAT